MHHWYDKYDIPALKLEIQDLIEKVVRKKKEDVTIELLLVAATMGMKKSVCEEIVPRIVHDDAIDEEEWRQAYDTPWVVQAAFECLLDRR